MKARFFFLGLCALALAACSLDEVSQVNDTNAVTFKGTMNTRATAVTTNTLSGFSVWAWNGDNEFMDDVIASRSGSSNTFTTSPLYFWPTGTVDFYAVSPATELYGIETDNYGNQAEYAYFGGELNEGDDEDTGWTYSGYVAKAQIGNDNIVFDVTIPSKAEDQIDLCYAINKNQSSGSVPMNFRHVLSQVVFKAKNVNEDFVVDIAGVSVCSVFKTGTYTLKGVEPTTSDITVANDDSKGVWDYDNEGHKARFAAGIATTTLDYNEGETVEIMADGGALMLLPQTVEKWDVYTDLTDSSLGSYIAVLCRVTEHGSLLWPNANEDGHTEFVDGVEYAYIAMPVDVEWEEGYRYTYTIIFGEGLGYYPPDDDAFDLEGTPVLVPITFDVTVDEFQDTEGVEVTTNTDVVVYNATDLVAAVERGLSPIEIAADITLEGYLEFNYDCELTIDAGCTLTGPDGTSDCYIDADVSDGIVGNYYTAIIFVNGGNLTIYGEGTVATGGSNESDYTSAILVENGSVTIYGGTYKGSNWSGEQSDVYTRSAVYCSNGGYAYIYGGDFYAGPSSRNNPSLDYGYHWVLNVKNSAYTDGTAMIYCYGGTYHDGFNPANLRTDDAPSYVAEGYGVTYDESTDCYTVVYSTVTTAADFEALIAAGVSEITVTEDIVLTDQIRVGDDLVLNLEANLTKESFDDNANTEQNFFFWVGGGATLTINASNDVVMSSGGLNGNNADDWVGCIQVGGNTGTQINTTGHLIINGGTYYGGVWNSTENYNSVATIYLLGGDVTIYDGIFAGGLGDSFKSYGYKANVKDYVENELTEVILNIYDNSREDPNDAWIYVYGGQFRNFDPSCNAVEGASTNFVVDGYMATKGEEDADGNIWFTVAKED